MTGAEVSLSCDDLVVVVSINVQASVGPGIKMAASLHSATRALIGADREVLIEGPRAVNAGLVDAGVPGQPISTAVTGHCAQICSLGRGVIAAKVLDDIVLDEWVASPTVDGEIAVAVILVGTGILDGSVHVAGVSAGCMELPSTSHKG